VATDAASALRDVRFRVELAVPPREKSGTAPVSGSGALVSDNQDLRTRDQGFA
jgi:hypothetical protein